MLEAKVLTKGMDLQLFADKGSGDPAGGDPGKGSEGGTGEGNSGNQGDNVKFTDEQKTIINQMISKRVNETKAKYEDATDGTEELVKKGRFIKEIAGDLEDEKLKEVISLAKKHPDLDDKLNRLSQLERKDTLVSTGVHEDFFDFVGHEANKLVEQSEGKKSFEDSVKDFLEKSPQYKKEGKKTGSTGQLNNSGVGSNSLDDEVDAFVKKKKSKKF